LITGVALCCVRASARN